MKKCSPQREVSGIMGLNLTFQPSCDLTPFTLTAIQCSAEYLCLSGNSSVSSLDKEEMLWCCPGRAVLIFFWLCHLSQGSKEVGSRGGGGGRELHGSPSSIPQVLTTICSPHWTPATLLKASPAYRWVSEIAQPPLLFRGIPWVGLGEGPSSWYKFTVLLSSVELSNQEFVQPKYKLIHHFGSLAIN